MFQFVLWVLGFGILWVGLKLFDDEVILIVAAIVGSALILAGLVLSPPGLQIVVEVAMVLALFTICIKCIERGNRQQ